MSSRSLLRRSRSRRCSSYLSNSNIGLASLRFVRFCGVAAQQRRRGFMGRESRSVITTVEPVVFGHWPSGLRKKGGYGGGWRGLTILW